ncbi:MAG: cytochrome c biogenesis CcdA family protein [Caldiserica bacterium]|jgi:cytochrome c-type biogenesis protein|nr:cytochrome c biogenesis CcdA family protein [Caldisericota bacterium]MDH7561955.1 cytochrome c biogenesis CcdA family protein [Caldisericota bacterium]
MVEVNFLVAFWAGVLSFFSPCTIPLLPVYLAYLGGASLKREGQGNSWKFFLGVLLFVLSLSLILFIQGFLAGSVGYFLFRFKRQMEIAFGILIFLLGLLTTGLLPFPFLYREWGVSLKTRIARTSPIFSGILLGLAFSLTWTPCSGPALASILALAASSTAPLKGGILLLVYSLGFSVPFILIAFFFKKLESFLLKKGPLFKALQVLTGFLFMALGILLALGVFQGLFF